MSFEEALEAAMQGVAQLERQVLDLVATNLNNLHKNAKLDRKLFWNDHDQAFGPLNDSFRPFWLRAMSLRAVDLWFKVEELVEGVEAKTGQSIHKGAPLYNVGLAFLMAGDFARATQFIAAAGHENELSKGEPALLHTGRGNSEDALLRPLYRWIEATFGADYRAATGRPLDAAEVKTLVVDFLGQRPEEALMIISSLWRFAPPTVGPQNAAAQLQRVRAYGDLLVTYESSLRRWQGTGGGELRMRSESLLNASKAAAQAFDSRVKADPRASAFENPAVVNQSVRDALAAFDASSSVAEKLGLATYISYRMRNALMHALDARLEISTDLPLLERTFGLGLASLRASKFGEDGQLGTL